ncbi:MAG: Crp/Fnr family transcriptional regulator [Ruminococcaceae bacterium]|nr:Crp/Fnr family transcriptional regulator [Oscillospiraceae bacterium]
MKKYFDVLRKCSLFNDIENENILPLLGCLGAKVEEYDKKYTIFAEGNPARFIGIVLSGEAQMEKVDFYGNRSIVTKIGVSEMFGEAFACAGVDKIPVTVIANEPGEIMLLDCERILHSCSNACGFHRKIIFNLMKELATKNIMFHKKIEITSQRSTREKLMTYLMQQAKSAGSDSFTVPFDRQELADFLEVDRSGLSAEIGKLKKEGIIDCRKSTFTLL